MFGLLHSLSSTTLPWVQAIGFSSLRVDEHSWSRRFLGLLKPNITWVSNSARVALLLPNMGQWAFMIFFMSGAVGSLFRCFLSDSDSGVSLGFITDYLVLPLTFRRDEVSRSNGYPLMEKCIIIWIACLVNSFHSVHIRRTHRNWEYGIPVMLCFGWHESNAR